jgi:putative hydrolase of the HAD superfamily
MSVIRGVIFDYGGVLWDMKFEVTRDLEAEHGLRERALLETLYGNETWRQLEIGVGDREEWLSSAHRELESVAGRALPPLHMHWRDRQHLIEPNIDLIRRLRSRYKTSVLSNADSSLRGRLRDDHGIMELFDDVVVSAEVGMAKPDARIYRLAAQRLGLAAEECVFVDDLAGNVEAARGAGMHGVHFLVNEHDLEAQLAAVGVVAGR